MRMFSLLLFLCGINYGLAQTKVENGFTQYSIKTKETETINFYLRGEGSNKPLLIYLDGSGAYPLFQKTEDGIGSTVLLNLKKLEKEFCVALISKPGVPFSDSVKTSPSGYPIYPEPISYQRLIGLNWRVQSADQVIQYTLKNHLANSRKVVVIGFSEGAQVAPSLATKNKSITHIICFGGNGLNQLYDPIIQTRIKMATGQYTPEQAQYVVDSLLTTYKDIYRNPSDVKRQWYGHTYKRWFSFGSQPPVHQLLSLSIPIYWVSGGLDENPILSSDYIALAFIDVGKDNFNYKVYPNYDHSLNEVIMKNGQIVQMIPRYREVMEAAFEWLSQQH
jgi:pimeloyl-ACP methyl ester carboxylesterase